MYRLMSSGRDTSRKLRANISKKARGLKSEELEMPAKVNLPNISLSMPVLPSIKLSNNYDDDNDNEFTFNQPLTIEQFSSQVAEKTCRKQQKMTLKKTQSFSNTDPSSKNHHSSSPVLSLASNKLSSNTSKIENDKISIVKNNISVQSLTKNNKVPELSTFSEDSKHTLNKSKESSGSKLENTDTVNMVLDDSRLLESNNKKEQSKKLSVEQKKWTCDACWVSNNSDKTNCIACQTPKPGNSQKPLEITKSSTWTCDTCWVPNKNEIDACAACQTQKPGTVKKVVEQSSTWTCDACWVKNKTESINCISCSTVKPGSSIENKPEPSTQFKFGLNNNAFDKSGNSQFKFGFDSSITDQPSNQFKFGSTTFKTDNNKSDESTSEFKFGMVKSDEPLGTFKFGIDNSATQSVNKTSDITSNSNNTVQPSNQFKFGFEKKSDQPESQFKFGSNAQFKFGSDNVETGKSIQQKCVADSNKVTNELQFSVNNKNENTEKLIELKTNNSLFKFDNTKETEKPTSQIAFGSVDMKFNNSNSLVNVNKNEDLPKVNFVWNKKDKIETMPINVGTSHTISSTIGNTNQLVNGHKHSNETLNEDPKPPSGLLKNPQFSFSALSKQDQNLPDDQKNHKTFTFGSPANDNKSFATPLLATSNFPNTGPVFGASNAMFSSGLATSTPSTTLGSVSTPQFSFGSMGPPASSVFFSKNIKDNDKNPFAQASNSFASTTNLGFSFGTQSPPVFSVPNPGGFPKSSFEVYF